MKNVTDRVRVVPSVELSDMRLSGLAGRCGTVTEQALGVPGRLIGCMVLLDKPFQNEHLWFIPQDALEDEADR